MGEYNFHNTGSAKGELAGKTAGRDARPGRAEHGRVQHGLGEEGLAPGRDGRPGRAEHGGSWDRAWNGIARPRQKPDVDSDNGRFQRPHTPHGGVRCGGAARPSITD